MRGNDAAWYLLGVAIIIGGLAVSVFGVVHDIHAIVRAVGNITRFVVPGSLDVTITKPGTYVLYYEYKSVLNGEIFATAQETDVTCSAKTLRSGQDVQIEPSALSATYEVGGRAGKAIAQFRASEIGTYVLTCAHPSSTGPRIVLAIAPPVGGDWLVSIFKWLAVAFASLGVGLIILIVTLVRRASTLVRPTPPI